SMKAASISRLFLVGNTLIFSPNERAATCASFVVISATRALAGFHQNRVCGDRRHYLGQKSQSAATERPPRFEGFATRVDSQPGECGVGPKCAQAARKDSVRERSSSSTQGIDRTLV